MSFNEKQMEAFYRASIKGHVLPNMQYVNQRGRGFGNKTRRKQIYHINQRGSGPTLVTPIAQDIQQAKSIIQHRNSIKRPAPARNTSQPKRRRIAKKKSTTKPSSKKKKKKVTKQRGRSIKKKTPRKRTSKTRKDIFGRKK